MKWMEKKTDKSETAPKTEEARKPLEQLEVELSDDELEKVAGGGYFGRTPERQM